jgi:hypothetical protein
VHTGRFSIYYSWLGEHFIPISRLVKRTIANALWGLKIQGIVQLLWKRKSA